MSEDELDDTTIRKGLLHLFARLPEDGSKHLNRTNVLGRPYQPGDLERHLNRTFTIEERARADRLMRQLESEGLLVPTHRDLISPGDWLIITAKGRKALAAPPDPGPAVPKLASSKSEQEFDAFLCHASEDKNAVVMPFAKMMKDAGFRPWLDAAQVGWGDSLVKAIEHGLTKSRFVIVFISEAFLKKDWTEKELRTALSMEIGGVKKVLPVLLGIQHEVLQKSHPFVAEKLYKSIRPYDASKPVSEEQLKELLEALRQELAKPE